LIPRGVIDLIKGIEQPLQMFLGDSGSRIGDVDKQLCICDADA
jgi:hypothetical protein